MYNKSKMLVLVILASLTLLAVAAMGFGVPGQGFMQSLWENNTSSISMNNTTNATMPSNVTNTTIATMGLYTLKSI